MHTARIAPKPRPAYTLTTNTFRSSSSTRSPPSTADPPYAPPSHSHTSFMPPASCRTLVSLNRTFAAGASSAPLATMLYASAACCIQLYRRYHRRWLGSSFSSTTACSMGSACASYRTREGRSRWPGTLATHSWGPTSATSASTRGEPPGARGHVSLAK